MTRFATLLIVGLISAAAFAQIGEWAWAVLR